jgi:hypothetical protein
MKVGKTAIPTQGIKLLIGDTYSTFKLHDGRQMTKQELADSIGIVVSGSLNQKIGDFKKYGLLGGQGNNFRLTTLAIELYTTKDPALLIKSIKHVPFYSYLLGKYSDPITPEIIRKELIEYAKLKPEMANSMADKVYKLFHESADFASSKPNLEEMFASVSQHKPPPTPGEIKPPQSEQGQRSTVEESATEDHRLSIKYGDTEIPIVTASSISLARWLIAQKEKKIPKGR